MNQKSDNISEAHEVPTEEFLNSGVLAYKNSNLKEIFNGNDNLKFYSFTIKNIRKNYFATESELLVCMNQMLDKHKAKLINFTFELDSCNRNHIHGTFKARKGLKYTLFKKHYYHIMIKVLEEFHDLKRWSDYIHKCPFNNFLKGLEKGEYMFVDADTHLDDNIQDSTK